MTENSIDKAGGGERGAAQTPQYARISEVQRQLGVARNTIHNLLKSGKVRSCSLLVTGKRSRIKLVDLNSLRAYIEAGIREQAKEATR